MRSANPALSDNVFIEASRGDSDSTTMTLGGTVLKSATLLALTFGSAVATWIYLSAAPGLMGPVLIGSSILGFGVALAIIFNQTLAPWASPIYALLEGAVVGAVSLSVQAQFPDVPIVLQAATLTFTTFAGLLAAYTTGLIKATENFKLGVVSATLGIAGLYLITFVLGLAGVTMPFIHDTGPIGIGISLFIVVIAALNLVLDFDFIENGVAHGAPKYMEWYAAFGLLVTLVWLYLEFLRLLSKLNRRN